MMVVPDHVTVWKWACPETIIGRWFAVDHGVLRRREGWYVRYLCWSEARGASYSYRSEVPAADSQQWVAEVLVGVLAQDYWLTLRRGARGKTWATLQRGGTEHKASGDTVAAALLAVCLREIK